MQQPAVTRTAVVQNWQGIHARPAEQVARAAMSYQSTVELVIDGRSIDAKSILNILTLGAAKGTCIEVRACGLDAAEAAEALAVLIASEFDPEPADQPAEGQSG